MSAIQLIPLHKLVQSPNNVRRTHRKADEEALAASILAHGLLQNLTVSARADGKYAVEAGGRRHNALKRLVREGKLAKNWPVPCVVIDADAAAEASLAENIQRVEMNAMDEVEAFVALVDAGAGVDDIAQRFGASVRHVEQRLALGRLSPSLRAAYRSGQITLDVARAFCISADPEAQARVFKGLAKPITNAGLVRNALTAGRIAKTDRLALFVGLAAYEAAGGRLARDLFDATSVFLEDGEILQRLALEKAEALRAAHAEGWGWSEINLTGAQIEGCASERLHARVRQFSPAETRRLRALETKIARLEAELEALADCDGADALWDERRALDQEREQIMQAARVFEPAEMAHAGLLVSVDRDGKAVILRGLIRRTDLKAIAKLRRANLAASGDDQVGASGSDSGSGFSKALMRELTLARTRAIREGVAAAPHLALALLVCMLGHENVDADALCGVDIQATAHDFDDAYTLQGLKPRKPAPQTLKDCLALDAAELSRCLAMRVAQTIDLTHEGVSARDQARQRSSDTIASALALDMGAHWCADAAFWARAPRALALQILRGAKAFREEDAESKLKALAKLKKAAFAEAAAKAMSASRWLPDCLVTPDLGAPPAIALDAEAPEAEAQAERA